MQIQSKTTNKMYFGDERQNQCTSVIKLCANMRDTACDLGRRLASSPKVLQHTVTTNVTESLDEIRLDGWIPCHITPTSPKKCLSRLPSLFLPALSLLSAPRPLFSSQVTLPLCLSSRGSLDLPLTTTIFLWASVTRKPGRRRTRIIFPLTLSMDTSLV